jgi:hypothetical protein
MMLNANIVKKSKKTSKIKRINKDELIREMAHLLAQELLTL